MGPGIGDAGAGEDGAAAPGAGHLHASLFSALACSSPETPMDEEEGVAGGRGGDGEAILTSQSVRQAWSAVTVVSGAAKEP